MRVLGVDPGGTTGLCYLTITGNEYELSTEQVGPEWHHFELYNKISSFVPNAIAYERFDYRKNLENADLVAVEYIGIIKLYKQKGHGLETELVPQTQLKGKAGNSLWSDDKLKELGCYEPAKSHANDAVRQALYYVTQALGDMHFVRQYGHKE